MNDRKIILGIITMIILGATTIRASPLILGSADAARKIAEHLDAPPALPVTIFA
jgi:hypothetical protein